MDESIDVGKPHLIVKDGEPVGIVAVAPGTAEERLRADLEQAGYGLAEPDDGDTMAIDDECEVEKPRTCEVSITLGRIDELAEDAGVSSAEIGDLEHRRFTEAEAMQAARAVIDRMPDGEQRTEAETFYGVAFLGRGQDQPNG